MHIGKTKINKKRGLKVGGHTCCKILNNKERERERERERCSWVSEKMHTEKGNTTGTHCHLRPCCKKQEELNEQS